ncbi:hypothetical protein BHF71_06920 [Vulcanibacillus modesticaldus]|uniref:SAM-dependent MTase RsmB/NOP-type domain-containing protein n=1 Tax=Vulcanibacillus modesticaldus TaxID=337097 RepID=A0A1D2YWC5_9BACI|nr:RsmF rRNA methyltransferase first C-terminal domain-containing protein [Vulcanibacillus modesticaldus]OEF99998.1 hypothetical protein BHF71_06920 [Vulcanibacillus modesticaldus]
MIKLPLDFMNRMQELLGNEYDQFIESYNRQQTHGLRVNLLKCDVKDFLSISPFSLTPIPWCDEGYYYNEEDKPGKHPYHAAGLYYIQEPSAMVVAKILEPKPYEKVLDLSAAPGGKSTHIASLMGNTGLLVANEIHPTRVKALAENLERFGARNAVITNESPNKLAKVFPEFFDRIIVDAPCSGEGMFRKNPTAIEDWSIENVKYCAIRQLEILDEAQKMLKPGGVLVYSTCTFAPEENEGTIANFLNKYPMFEVEQVTTQLNSLLDEGQPKWIGHSEDSPLKKTIRLWPHHFQGEGHFVAKLRKKEGIATSKIKLMKFKPLAEAVEYYQKFANEYLEDIPSGHFHSFSEHLYLVPDQLPDLRGIKIVRLGWHLGELKKKRFEPSHALAMGLTNDQVKQYYDLDVKQATKYLRGEAIQSDTSQTGWSLITIGKYPLGWGKISNGQIKNHYPKGLRWK